MTAIETWRQLVEQARHRWPIVAECPRSITIGTAAKQLHLDRIETREPIFAARELVAIRAALGAYRPDPQEALALNAHLVCGAIAVGADGYELRHVVDLAEVSLDRLDRLMGHLGALSDIVKREHTHRLDETHYLNHYTY